MSSEIRTTPIAPLVFSYVTESTKDTEFSPEGIYHCTLRLKKLEAEPEIAAIQEVIKKTIANAHLQKKGLTKIGTSQPLKRAPLPYKMEEDGSVLIKFKSKYAPALYDGNRQELSPDVSIYKGSTARVKYKLSGYNQSVGIGCVLHLIAVQVANLVDTNDNKECPFGEIATAAPRIKLNQPIESVLPAPEKAVY
jgi:hypothetical protein|tara:strand:+ start:335 stop:916 length:582 start_codon:yes stop_codon:yes gene_type:complete